MVNEDLPSCPTENYLYLYPLYFSRIAFFILNQIKSILVVLTDANDFPFRSNFLPPCIK